MMAMLKVIYFVILLKSISNTSVLEIVEKDTLSNEMPRELGLVPGDQTCL